jgi:hypothetical protein
LPQNSIPNRARIEAASPLESTLEFKTGFAPSPRPGLTTEDRRNTPPRLDFRRTQKPIIISRKSATKRATRKATKKASKKAAGKNRHIQPANTPNPPAPPQPTATTKTPTKQTTKPTTKQPTQTAAPRPADAISSLEQQSIAALEATIETIRELVEARTAAKLSINRLAGVARELKELLKVMSIYVD